MRANRNGLRHLRYGLVTGLVACLLAVGGAQAEERPPLGRLDAQVRSFAERERLRLIGLSLLANAPARPAVAGGTLHEQLDRLLAGYNYLVTVDEEGRPATVRILGERLDPPPAATATTVTVTTQRRGRHHLVPVTVVGRNGAERRVLLMLDTGASTVVLPQSLAAPLGFADATLTESMARTAGGPIAVRLGQLRQVRVGAAAATDVAVAFVDDATLGDGSLLGMSFLERFDVRLEDGHDRLTLSAR